MSDRDRLTGVHAMMRRLAVTVVFLTAAAHASAQTEQSADALSRWVAAVKSHQPGQPDEAVKAIVALSYADRAQMNPAMRLFLAAVKGERADVPKAGPQVRIVLLFQSVRTDPGVAAFLKRAAVLHADTAIFAGPFPAAAEGAPPPAEARFENVLKFGPLTPPLPGSYVMHADGRVIGRVQPD